MLALAMFGCSSVAEADEVAVVSSTVVPSSSAIVSIALFTHGSGDRATEWVQQHITITSDRTVAERGSGFVPVSRTEGHTSAREWQRLCTLFVESGLFSAPGERVLVSGFHAGNAVLTVKFDDGTVSKVEHGAFYSESASPFWTLVRVIEGSSLNALPLPLPPERSR